jgi:hypothetical protein
MSKDMSLRGRKLAAWTNAAGSGAMVPETDF